jgi:murein endopeptidase
MRKTTRARSRHRLRRRLGITAVAAVAAATGGAWAGAQSTPQPKASAPPSTVPERPRGGPDTNSGRRPSIRWRRSQELGTPGAGRLVDGVLLPAAGADFFTWDRVERRPPNPPDRRWGSDRLIRTLLDVLREHRAADPEAARVGIGDLSRKSGGPFTGPSGHVSHQNGLDADVFYPRHDGRLRAPVDLGQIDRERAQDLVDRFVAAGAEKVFVDARLGLSGPAGVVQHWPGHADHLHVRLPG